MILNYIVLLDHAGKTLDINYCKHLHEGGLIVGLFRLNFGVPANYCNNYNTANQV